MVASEIEEFAQVIASNREIPYEVVLAKLHSLKKANILPDMFDPNGKISEAWFAFTELYSKARHTTYHG